MPLLCTDSENELYEWRFDEIRDKCCPVRDIEKGAQIRDVPANTEQLATLYMGDSYRPIFFQVANSTKRMVVFATIP